jgi:hypothetical protein
MTRPKDESGRLLPQAHKRLDNAHHLEMAGVRALSEDGRLNHLDLKRKLVIARKAIDHATDGDTPPSWVFKKDPGNPDNRALAEGWDACLTAVRHAAAV